MQPGITAEDCPNAEVCGLLIELSEEEEVELVRVREERSRRLEERLQLTNRQAAVLMLRSRGRPQTPESLGLVEVVESLAEKLEEVRSQLGQFEGKNVYIAPEGVEIHRYNVKRPRGIYFYNKLLAQTPIFEPAERQQQVRVIHLSKSEDARTIEGALGIERRNRLTQARTQLRNAEAALTQAFSLLSE